jgi:hypothetical protein
MKKKTQKNKKPVKKIQKKKTEPKKESDKKLALTTDLTVLEAAFDGDKEMVLFFLSWLKNNRNATKAYQEIHPGVSERVAAVLGSRKLRKVDIGLVLESYGIGIPDYFDQLKEGLKAMKQVEGMLIGPDGVQKAITEIPDHKTRRVYHKALGKILKIEDVENVIVNNVQNNNSNLIENINEDELDDLIS